VRIWDVNTGLLRVLRINDTETVNYASCVTSVAISPNGQLVAAGSLDTFTWIWDIETGSLVECLRGHQDSVYSVAFTPDGKGLVSGSLDKTSKYWDVSGLLPGGIEGPKVTPPSGGLNIRKATETTSQCTMHLTGHKAGST
jgi:glucose repression regulatory protein TUP1